MKFIMTLLIMALSFSACSPVEDQGASGETCGSHQELFNHPLVDEEYLTAIAPLGTINPPHHTYPTGHMYPALTSDQPVNLYAPGNVMVTSVARTTYTASNFRQGFSDYSVRLKPCNEVMMTIGHIPQLSEALSEAVSQAENCITRSTPNETVEECTANLTMLVSSGDLLGQVGHPGLLSGFDWGIIDTRVNNFLVNPERSEHYIHIACPIDYFTSSLKSDYESLTGRTEGPVCGEVTYDVAGTAQGIWVLESQADISYVEGAGLTLGKDHMDPTQYVIGIANVGSDLDSTTTSFTPQSSGQVNRDFADITADNQIYCYDNFSTRVLIRLEDDGSLILETQVGQTCAASPYSFSASALTFIR